MLDGHGQRRVPEPGTEITGPKQQDASQLARRRRTSWTQTKFITAVVSCLPPPLRSDLSTTFRDVGFAANTLVADKSSHAFRSSALTTLTPPLKMYRADSGPSQKASGMTQIRSGLGSMKRSWSGNKHDLGDSSGHVKQKRGAGHPSSEEVFYEWSDSPSPPMTLSRSRPGGCESDKENTLEAYSSKKAKTGPAAPPPPATRHVGSQNGFVTASSVFRPHTTATQPKSASQSSVCHPSSTAKSTHGGQPVRYHKSREFATKFEEERKSAAQAQQSRSSSLPNLDYRSTASQIRELQRNDTSNSGLKLAGPSNERAVNATQLGVQKQVNKVFLSNEQRAVLEMVVKEGKNVFFTGSAGTGKSVLLREIIRALRHKYSNKLDSIAVTASTGIAACNIGGVTLHSFAGVGLGTEETPALVKKVRGNRQAATRWMRLQVLIIDEISMVDPGLLDDLECIARSLRKKSDRPFGGIQLIITGDFFQLPPVLKTDKAKRSGKSFAFQAECWDRVVTHKVNLTKVFRQKDPTFVTMLNEMRFGNLSRMTIDTFARLTRQPDYGVDIIPTELFPLRAEVEKANKDRLNNIQSEAHVYKSIDGGAAVPIMLEKALASFMAPKEITLKVGAQVMLIKNLTETLVNGSIGKVIDFMDEAEYSQMTEGAPQEQVKDDRNAPVRVSRKKWPLVRFSLPNNGGTKDYLAVQESWQLEKEGGVVEASRYQIPLILAWAISIHKAQGQTLPCCKIDLARIFEKGQAYVALSRATSLDGLQVLNFRPYKVMAHPVVIEWSKSLKALH